MVTTQNGPDRLQFVADSLHQLGSDISRFGSAVNGELPGNGKRVLILLGWLYPHTCYLYQPFLVKAQDYVLCLTFGDFAKLREGACIASIIEPIFGVLAFDKVEDLLALVGNNEIDYPTTTAV